MASLILKGMKNIGVVGEPWISPDGKVTITNIKLEDPSGEQGMYATMSKAVATVGFTGDIELYTNAKGKDYVRQAPKEEVVASVSNTSSTAWESPERQASINRAVALNNAVNLYASTGGVGIDVLKRAEEFYTWLQNEAPEKLVDPFAKDIGVGDIPEYTEEDQ